MTHVGFAIEFSGRGGIYTDLFVLPVAGTYVYRKMHFRSCGGTLSDHAISLGQAIVIESMSLFIQ